ncbi:hypothetical protein C8P64_1607 [Christiangramia gaetbulicola]|uniref:FAD-binding domain-containing protein n=1 Tax=Christiangramia gaetbulicola TaxID=703340 RepID=A0A2T6AH06_9FLAO|nr:NAD(P)/FAD-dependent oxidoreductase [Christiangramia gaetbulicola]PTX43081.1 hypothetical protein C8P64_1607 [Christiangramia gaetbulicola]
MKKPRVIIIGGGLAGLTAAIDLCKRGIEVILFEKDEYPHHKVCGEYLSAEILPYYDSLGIDLGELNAPEIHKLEYSSNSGKTITCDLQMGGLGISRYNLDHFLYRSALNLGCTVITVTVTEVSFNREKFTVLANDEEYMSDFVLGAFGKRSNLDKKLDRDFFKNQSGWLAVKAHYKDSEHPEDLVSLHNFNGGYCGLSRTEINTVNVCYLASYSSFKKHKNTETFKNSVLMKNPRLNEFFQRSEPVFQKDLSIAQVNFDRKSLIEDHIMMIGDAAGLIHPLCGNGMAMAIHSAKLAVECLVDFYSSKETGRQSVEKLYRNKWQNNFNNRIRSGRILQKVLLNDTLSELSQNIIAKFPGIMPQIIRSTHGKPIYV